MSRLFLLFAILILVFVSCSKYSKLENKSNEIYYSNKIIAQIDRLLNDNPDYNIIDVYVYKKNVTYIVLALTNSLDIHYYNSSFTYQNKYIIHYGGFCDSLAMMFIDLRKFNKFDSVRCIDNSKFIIDPCMPHMYIVRNDSIVEISSQEENWFVFDSLYYDKYGVHTYYNDINVPAPSSIKQ